MMQSCQDLLLLGLVCAFSPGKDVNHGPHLGLKDLAFKEVAEYNLSPEERTELGCFQVVTSALLKQFTSLLFTFLLFLSSKDCFIICLSVFNSLKAS